MHKTFVTISLVLLASCVCFSQIKSLEDAQNEAKSFNDFAAFSVSYDETKYWTIAEIKTEVLDEKDSLRKQFSKFEWTLSTFFAIKGIDAKPVRNTLCVNSQSKTFAFSRENFLTLFLHDGEANLGEPNRLSEIKKGKANEKLCWEVDNTIFPDLAENEKIEFQIGTIKSQISSDKMQVFKDYANLIKAENAK